MVNMSVCIPVCRFDSNPLNHFTIAGRRGSISNDRSGHDCLHDSTFTTPLPLMSALLGVLTGCERSSNYLVFVYASSISWVEYYSLEVHWKYWLFRSAPTCPLNIGIGLVLCFWTFSRLECWIDGGRWLPPPPFHHIGFVLNAQRSCDSALWFLSFP